jgi:hypothetical protein
LRDNRRGDFRRIAIRKLSLRRLGYPDGNVRLGYQQSDQEGQKQSWQDKDSDSPSLVEVLDGFA